MVVGAPHVYEPTLLEFGSCRFLIMDAPTDSNLPAYIEKLRKHRVGTVVRACEPTYSTMPLKKAKIDVLELAFPDGESPPEAVIHDWLDLVDSYFTATPAPNEKNIRTNDTIAVHCVAGLGR